MLAWLLQDPDKLMIVQYIKNSIKIKVTELIWLNVIGLLHGANQFSPFVKLEILCSPFLME